MTYEQLRQMALALGFAYTAALDCATIELKPEVRQMCANNTCGQYGKRWSCPPGCGTLEDCRAQLAGKTTGILVQSVGDIEDGFDFEAMMEIEQAHKQRFLAMYDQLRKQGLPALAIGSGCCTLCQECTYPDAPCRFPQRRVASMEAFGMLVVDVCKANGLGYYYGPEKMAYTSCFVL